MEHPSLAEVLTVQDIHTVALEGHKAKRLESSVVQYTVGRKKLKPFVCVHRLNLIESKILKQWLSKQSHHKALLLKLLILSQYFPQQMELAQLSWNCMGMDFVVRLFASFLHFKKHHGRESAQKK